MRRSLWRRVPQQAVLALLLVPALGGCAPQSPTTAATTPTPTQQTSPTSTPTATTPTATPAPTVKSCQPSQLTLKMLPAGAAAGHEGEDGVFKNQSSVTCTLFGFPGAQMLDAQHHPIPTKALWQTSAYMYTNQQKTLVALAPGGSAYFALTWSDVTVGSETSCPTSSYLSVTPPNDFSVLTVADQITACGGGSLEISPVEPAPVMSPVAG